MVDPAKYCPICKQPCHHEGRICTCILTDSSTKHKWTWNPSFTLGDLHERLINDLSVIANICGNFKLAYRARISEIKAITDKLEEDLKPKVEPTPQPYMSNAKAQKLADDFGVPVTFEEDDPILGPAK